MTIYRITFEPSHRSVEIPSGSLLHEAAEYAGVEINMPCGGQGRCGRCAVIVTAGNVRRRSTLRLAQADIERGYALACQTIVEGDVTVSVPAQEKIERRLTTDRTAVEVTVPPMYDPLTEQPVRAVYLEIDPPSLDDQTDDWSRLQRALRTQYALDLARVNLPTARRLSQTLRQANWQVTAILDSDDLDQVEGPYRLVDLLDGKRADRLFGAAVDIGTTSNVVYLVDLTNGKVVAQAADYNGQISRGEDVISRIVYAGKNDGLNVLQRLVLETLNKLLARVARKARIETSEIYRVTVAGNTAMMHLFLGMPPESIRQMPFITTMNQPPRVLAAELGLNANPEATVDCLPGIASYVGADITAGVISSAMSKTDKLTLFMDIGTNGEIVLGMQDWMISCACSAGPAFEGAGVKHGIRATEGAIEEVWINHQTQEPTYRVIGGKAPKGICGSGLISLLAELFITGIMDKAGNLRQELSTPRIRVGRHRAEYVVAWAEETGTDEDIVLTEVDIENLLRAKAAIYAGYTVLCDSVGIEPSAVEQVIIAGAFGQYVNIEKAIQIGLLPDMPWGEFNFIGNASVRGAYLALISTAARRQIHEVAHKLTYLELSADNSFYNRFMSALFLPHTDITLFPSVRTLLNNHVKSEDDGEPDYAPQPLGKPA